MNEEVGLLVHGDNHFIVRGPLPDRATAFQLVREWSVIHIARTTPTELRGWRISTREFREDLQWAVMVPGQGEISLGVVLLLDELSARGISIRDAGVSDW